MTNLPRIRVLVVDDSAIARRFITKRLELDNELEVVGTASSAPLALKKIERDPPDVVVLDDEMPEMTGREMLRVLRKQHPEVAVVMFSARVGAGTTARFEALYLGADDAVAKPSASSGPVRDDHPTWTELVTKAKKAARRAERGGVHVDVARSARRERPASAAPAPVTPTRPSPVTGSTGTPAARPAPHVTVAPPRRGSARRPVVTTDPGAVIIASSTGGPNALGVVFENLPDDFPLPILIAQHMPPDFTRLLADRLDSKAAVTTVEAGGGEPIARGRAYVAPGGHHLEVNARHLGCATRLGSGPPENSCRPAADVLFRTAVAAYGDRLIAVVLSGMGQDGMLGCEEVRAAGGQVIAQDEETSVVWGMPGAVVRAGLADVVLPIEAIADEMTRRARALMGPAALRTTTGVSR